MALDLQERTHEASQKVWELALEHHDAGRAGHAEELLKGKGLYAVEVCMFTFWKALFSHCCSELLVAHVPD